MVDTFYQVKTNELNFARATDASDLILAAIDIGTNSVHMVVVKIDPSLPAFTIIAREKDTVRLGERDPKTGDLTPEAMTRAISALQRCRDLAVSLQARQIMAVATSATREAPNGLEFLQTIQNELGLTVDLISGPEEARRIYLGVLSGMDFNGQPHVIIDIGGGSTELILADSQEARFLSSTKIGAVRLTQELVHSDPISSQELVYLQAYIRGMLERSVEGILATVQPGEQLRLVGTSGTIETLATIHAMEKLGSVPKPLHGYQVSYKEVKDFAKRFATMTYEQRFAIPGMSDKRAEIILSGALVLQEAMSMLNLTCITICERSLREGMIVDWMLSHGLIENRLRYQSEIRQRSILKIAQKYEVSQESSLKVADFALSLFDQTRGYLHHWGDEQRELLWGAAILHNCGLYVSHAAHHKHSYYLIRNSELLGYNEREIEIIANIARYHRKSKPKKRHENYTNIAAKLDRLAVSQLSAILRIAIALDRRQISAISQLKCECYFHYRQVHLHLVPTRADDDCSLELWSLDYKKGVFEEEFGVKVIATLVPFLSEVN